MDFAKSSDRWIGDGISLSGRFTGSAHQREHKRHTAFDPRGGTGELAVSTLPDAAASPGPVGCRERFDPVRQSALDIMADFRQKNAQWAQVVGWLDSFQPAPRLASWRTVRRILQDAAWQIFSPIVRVDGIPGVLEELDGMVKEMGPNPDGLMRTYGLAVEQRRFLMDFSLALTFQFKDPRWIQKIGLAALISLIPVVGHMIVSGLVVPHRPGCHDPGGSSSFRNWTWRRIFCAG